MAFEVFETFCWFLISTISSMMWNLRCFTKKTIQEEYFRIGSMIKDEAECKVELRFDKSDLAVLLHALRFPDRFVCSQRTVCSGMEGLCILLKRLAFPCRYTDMVMRFGRNPTELCLIFNHVLDFVYQTHQHRLKSWNQPFLNTPALEQYAQSIHARGAPLLNCFAALWTGSCAR